MKIEKDHLRAASFCLGIGLLILFAMVMSACRTSIPPIDVRFWAGDSVHSGITRAQDKATLTCDMPDFDKFVCLTYEDVKKIFNLMLQCKNWSSTPATTYEIHRFMKENPEVIRYVMRKEKRNRILRE